MSNDLKTQPATMSATIQVTRKDTGKVEEWTLNFTPVSEDPAEAPTDAAPPLDTKEL